MGARQEEAKIGWLGQRTAAGGELDRQAVAEARSEAVAEEAEGLVQVRLECVGRVLTNASMDVWAGVLNRFSRPGSWRGQISMSPVRVGQPR